MMLRRVPRPWGRRRASRRLARLSIGGMPRCPGVARAAPATVGGVPRAVPFGSWRAGRRRWWRDSRAAAAADRELRRVLPQALELVAAALRGGSPPSQAMEAVGRALLAAGPGMPAHRRLGHRLCQVAASLRLGGDIRSAWASVPEAEPGRPLAAAALAMSRLEEGGAPVAVALTGLATDLRSEQRAASIAAARRAGVLAVLPLGLCFLPSFVLIAVLPVVVAAARQVLGH